MTQESLTKPIRKNKTKIIGRKFGRWFVLEKNNKNNRTCFKCQCECGTIKTIDVGNLVSGRSQSCGCLNIEKHTTHGMWNTPEYKSWHMMLTRCNNSNYDAYHHYGGRGIKVCKRWHKFENFFEDMGKKPGKKYSIDRILNDDNYYKENCRWATNIQQHRNNRVRKDNNTGVRGIALRVNRYQTKYLVTIGEKNIRHYIGIFETFEDAIIARKAAEQKYWKVPIISADTIDGG